MAPTFAGRRATSEDLEHAVDRAVRKAVTDTDCLYAVEPAELAIAHLELRSNAEVVARRIDGLATLQALNDICRAMAQAAIRHRYGDALVGFENEPNIECETAVGAKHLPVVACHYL